MIASTSKESLLKLD